MKRRVRVQFAGVIFASLAAASAQIKVDVTNLTASTQKSPDFEVGSGIKKIRNTQKDWLQILVEFTVTGGDRREDFVGNMEFRFFALPHSAPREAKKLYTTTVNHVDILKGEKLHSAIYVSPNALHRIFGRDKTVGPRDFWVAVEIYAAGKLVGYKMSDQQVSRWWRREDVDKDTGTLRPKHITPFRDLWYDSFAETRD